jgi:hypothetical protein
MASIQHSLDLLNELESLGFNDEAFWRLHHFRTRGDKDTVQLHRDYLTKQLAAGATLRDNDSNEEVQRRMQLVLDWYKRGAFNSDPAGVFAGLAEVAFELVPHRRSGEA